MPERSQALKSYGQLVNNLWEDETLVERLKAAPHATLNQYGFAIPEAATVNLIFRELNVDGSPDTQVAMLSEGETTGVYNIIVPSKPADTDLSNLPLEEEVLELVAGGVDQDVGIAPCCCCCPCCGS